MTILSVSTNSFDLFSKSPHTPEPVPHFLSSPSVASTFHLQLAWEVVAFQSPYASRMYLACPTHFPFDTSLESLHCSVYRYFAPWVQIRWCPRVYNTIDIVATRICIIMSSFRVRRRRRHWLIVDFFWFCVLIMNNNPFLTRFCPRPAKMPGRIGVYRWAVQWTIAFIPLLGHLQWNISASMIHRFLLW